jgi:hypothetical protein
MKKNIFSGPVFIVGMPRSGKKLLRDLLNQNPRIGIPIHETGFIPRLVNHFGNPPRFDDEDELQRFFDEFSQDPFYQQFKIEGRNLRRDDLDKIENKFSWQSIFEYIFRFYAPNERAEDFIWGDKSPYYLNFMPLLNEIFPNAKFIHSIRDPRDYCLSFKKAWGKSIFRAAENWRVRMEAALSDLDQLSIDYMEVFYESLLEDPRKTLMSVCEFLDCEYISAMTTLTRAPERFGDTGGQVRIVRENRKKFLTQLSPSQIKRVEEIVCHPAKICGYKLENNVDFKPVKPYIYKLLTLYDGWASIMFHINQYGVRYGFRRLFHWHFRSRVISSEN